MRLGRLRAVNAAAALSPKIEGTQNPFVDRRLQCHGPFLFFPLP